MRKRGKVAITIAVEASRYVEGYRRTPERAADVLVALAAAIPALGEEPWDARTDMPKELRS